jgi:hypothetical protein
VGTTYIVYIRLLFLYFALVTKVSRTAEGKTMESGKLDVKVLDWNEQEWTGPLRVSCFQGSNFKKGCSSGEAAAFPSTHALRKVI